MLKKYPSLEEDFARFERALEADGQNLTGLERLQLGAVISVPFYKARKFRCKSLNAGCMSGIRVIFCWQQQSDAVEVTFVEIYYKGQQENHDQSRVLDFCREMESSGTPVRRDE